MGNNFNCFLIPYAKSLSSCEQFPQKRQLNSIFGLPINLRYERYSERRESEVAIREENLA